MLLFFFQAEDGIRDYKVTGVQTCALPISLSYWIFLAISGGAMFILITASSQSSTVTFDIIIALLFLPVAQLVASILTSIWIVIHRASFPEKGAAQRILWKATLWSVLGSLAGGMA